MHIDLLCLSSSDWLLIGEFLVAFNAQWYKLPKMTESEIVRQSDQIVFGTHEILAVPVYA